MARFLFVALSDLNAAGANTVTVTANKMLSAPNTLYPGRLRFRFAFRYVSVLD